MLSEELIERQWLERSDKAKCLPGRKTAHRIEYSGHRWLMSRKERSDVEFECGLKIGGVHGDNVTRIRARLP